MKLISLLTAAAAQTESVVVEKSGVDPFIIVCVIFGVLIFGGLAFGLILMHKQKQNEQTGSSTNGSVHKAEESEKSEANHTVYDSRRIVEGIENIGDGIIVTDGGKRFVAAITCRGIDFYNEGLAEQLSTMRGYQSFLNLVEKPMTYRLYSKAVDIDSSKNRYAAKLEETIELFEQSGKELQIAKDRGASEETIRELAAVVSRYEQRIAHLNAQLEYMEFYSGTDVVMDVTQTYLFDWTYESGIAGTKLSPTEIFLMAKRELNTIATQKIDALAQAGIKGRMCTQDEIIDMIRRHSKPLSAELYKQRMVNTSSFEEDIIGSDSIDEATDMLQASDEAFLDDFFTGEGLSETLVFYGKGDYSDEE